MTDLFWNGSDRYHVNETPGHAPLFGGRTAPPVGEQVAIPALGHPGWRGIVVAHTHRRSDGAYVGIATVRCTDTGGLKTRETGKKYLVETRTIADARGEE